MHYQAYRCQKISSCRVKVQKQRVSKLVIQNDLRAIELSFISVLSDLINQQIESVSVNNCPNIQCNVQHPIQQLTITNSQFKNLGNLTTTTLVYLDLGFNSLEDVSAIGSLTNLKKLILRDNGIHKLDFLKSLVKLVQNNLPCKITNSCM
ncbi:Leucine-rich_repeat domain superfamily [Hexamita inflata]|uniref:Leucine-rich repeat domain superfamily n=1 Tax=Hexamita inflata TaxID=28002 RepID=A0AA86NA70_9EUKA|nr:Leucine-rich repeat domain superfamily [Hexamita inflata]